MGYVFLFTIQRQTVLPSHTMYNNYHSFKSSSKLNYLSKACPQELFMSLLSVHVLRTATSVHQQFFNQQLGAVLPNKNIVSHISNFKFFSTHFKMRKKGQINKYNPKCSKYYHRTIIYKQYKKTEIFYILLLHTNCSKDIFYTSRTSECELLSFQKLLPTATWSYRIPCCKGQL